MALRRTHPCKWHHLHHRCRPHSRCSPWLRRPRSSRKQGCTQHPRPRMLQESRLGRPCHSNPALSRHTLQMAHQSLRAYDPQRPSVTRRIDFLEEWHRIPYAVRTGYGPVGVQPTPENPFSYSYKLAQACTTILYPFFYAINNSLITPWFCTWVLYEMCTGYVYKLEHARAHHRHACEATRGYHRNI